MRIGRSAPVDEAAQAAEEARERRIDSARANRYWHEIEDDLVARGPFLVSASTDAVFSPYLGMVFGPHGRIEFNEMVGLYFVVRSGNVTMLERQPQTWSEIAYRRARKAAA